MHKAWRARWDPKRTGLEMWFEISMEKKHLERGKEALMVQGEVVGLSTSLPWSLLPCGTAPAGSLPCVPMGKSVGGSLVPASPLFFKGISGAKRKEKEKERKQVLIDHPDCFLMFLGRAKINNDLPC